MANSIKRETKETSKKSYLVISILIAIIGVLLTTYIYILKPNIVCLGFNNLVCEMEPSTTGGMYALVSFDGSFKNKSFKPGFIKDVKIVCEALNPSEYSAETVIIDQSRFNSFSSKIITVKIRIIYKAVQIIKETSSIMVYFYDNNGEQIMGEDTFKPAGYRISIIEYKNQ